MLQCINRTQEQAASDQKRQGHGNLCCHQQTERDVTKKLLELPIPTFNHESEAHRKLAALGKECRKKSEAAVHSGEFATDSSVARQRAFIRTHLESELEQIDKLVVKLISK
jgi:hypothetical protein